MKQLITKASLVFLLTGSLLLTACSQNFATSLRLVVAAGAPVLNILVQQGKISPALKDGLIADLTQEGFRVGDMAKCFNAIPSGDAQSKLKHLQCVQTLEQAPETRKLLKDFGANPAVQNIADDVDAILQAALIFYGGPPTATTRVSGRTAAGIGVAQPVTEKELNQ